MQYVDLFYSFLFRGTQTDPTWRETFAPSCHLPRTRPRSITTWPKASCRPRFPLCLPILLVICEGKSFLTLGTTCWKQAASFHQGLLFMPSTEKSSPVMAGKWQEYQGRRRRVCRVCPGTPNIWHLI